MITISGILIDGKYWEPSRSLTSQEEATVVFQKSDAQNFYYYQEGDQLPDFSGESSPVPNWNGLTQALWGSTLMSFALANASPNGFSLLLKVLTDGEASSASQNSFLVAFNACGLTLSSAQKSELNGYLTANNFTIQVT